MEFARFDSGDVLRKERGGQGPKMLRLVVGNPLIMKEMAKIVPDAGSYAPVTILIDERTDGVHLSYDSMASLLAPYGSEAALVVARDLDAKIKNCSRRPACDRPPRARARSRGPLGPKLQAGPRPVLARLIQRYWAIPSSNRPDAVRLVSFPPRIDAH